MNELKNQPCPFCKASTLTLIEDEKEIPYFGKCFLMSMTCTSCKYHSSDIEVAENKGPSSYTFTIKDKKDLNVRVVKSGQATIKIPQLKMSVTPGPVSLGYISNIEGVLTRFKSIIESQRDSAEDNKEKKAAKNLLKKLWKVELGEEQLKIIIEDPSGNSAIISKDAEVKKLKI